MASQQEPGSWKNPQYIMKVHRINRHSKSGQRSEDFINKKSNPQHQQYLPKSVTPLSTNQEEKKRKNPFLIETSAKQQKMEQNSNKVPDLMVESFGRGDGHHKFSIEPAIDKEDAILEGRKRTVTNATDAKGDKMKINGAYSSIGSTSPQEQSRPQSISSISPLDWSLKLKMRIVTDVDLNSTNKLPGMEARNVNGFVHSHFDTDEWHNMDVLERIRRCSHHYCYPNIASLSKFPRLSSHYGNKSSPIDTSKQEVLDAFHSDWLKAFTSVYQQLRSSVCAYFYLCTHQFTVLFRCLRDQGQCHLSAFLSPSTRGLRELLKQEGVTFRMPGVKQQVKVKDNQLNGNTMTVDSTSPSSLDPFVLKAAPSPEEEVWECEIQTFENHGKAGGLRLLQSSSHDKRVSDVSIQALKVCHEDAGNTKNDDNNDDDDKYNEADNDIDDNDDDNSAEDCTASSWLEEIGLEKKHFPSLLPQKVKAQKERFQEIDNRPQSGLYMERLEVHALFNFLSNYPPCIASSGPQYGLPPTILSPSPFVGGTLTVNTVKQSVIQAQSPSTPTSLQPVQAKSQSHVLEIQGPILPHHLLNLVAILQSAHGSHNKPSSSLVTFSSHVPTFAFNLPVDHLDAKRNSNILLTGMRKLLVPWPLNLGLIPAAQGRLLTKNCVSLKEARVTKDGVVSFHG